MLVIISSKKWRNIRICDAHDGTSRAHVLQQNYVTFPLDGRRLATASINDLCSMLHLFSGLLKSGFGHYMAKVSMLKVQYLHKGEEQSLFCISKRKKENITT